MRERRILDRIAKDEALSAASVVRRLIIREARKRGLWPLRARQEEAALSESTTTGQSQDGREQQ
jgi:hypothetical protein